MSKKQFEFMEEYDNLVNETKKFTSFSRMELIRLAVESYTRPYLDEFTDVYDTKSFIYNIMQDKIRKKLNKR